MRLVVKIGTSSLTDDDGVIDDAAVAKLSDEVAAARAAGHEAIVVSSGAVAAGVAALGLASRPSDVGTLQAISAAGQPRLMRSWDAALARHGLVPAQALLVPQDFIDRRSTCTPGGRWRGMLELGVVPIINENDAIASATRSATATTTAWRRSWRTTWAPALLVLLTDLDGLYTADPRRRSRRRAGVTGRGERPAARHHAPTSAGAGGGAAGMASKLEAARIASWSGVRDRDRQRRRGPTCCSGPSRGEPVGTRFEARKRRLGARKLWIAFAARVAGTVTVDAGARRALVERSTSLLPAGVVDVEGSFVEADTVEVRDADGGCSPAGWCRSTPPACAASPACTPATSPTAWPTR